MYRPQLYIFLSFLFVFFACGKKNTPTPTSLDYTGIVSTIAGNGGYGYQDGSAKTATFETPTGIVGDSFGNLFVADYYNGLIRKIDTSGNVTTLAGSRFRVGLIDGIGSQASFRYPHSVAIDNVGNLYIADSENNAIREITPSGVVTTIAGNGFTGSADGSVVDARFNLPMGVAIDKNNNLFVVDQGNSSIRKISSTAIVTTVAGGTFGDADGQGLSAQFATPTAIAIDSHENLYVADTGNGKVRKITSDGMVTTFAAAFGTLGVAVDSSDNIYISTSNTIMKITQAGQATVLAGDSQPGYIDGKGLMARFHGPNGLYVNSVGNIYVTDSGNNMIRIITQ